MKRALVTGCSRGIGRAVTEALLGQGWAVLGASRSEPIGLAHARFRWVRCNAAVPPHVGRLSDELAGARLDALVHCIGSQEPVGRFDRVDPFAWTTAVSTNLLGTARVVHAALPALLRAPDPRVLLFSGGGAFNPRPHYSAYAVSKAGVVSLMETLAAEMGGALSVNCVSPGFVATDIHRPTLAAGANVAGGRAYREAMEGMARDDGSQLARAVACVLYLLSPAARGLTGKTISAEHDDWPNLTPWNVERVNASAMGTRTRTTVQRLAELGRLPASAVI